MNVNPRDNLICFNGSYSHFLFKYVIKHVDGKENNMCMACFTRDMEYYGAFYRVVRRHKVIKLCNQIIFMQDVNNWCSNCVNMPLFEFYGRNTCMRRNNLHGRLRSWHNRYSNNMFWRYEYQHAESDDDSDSSINLVADIDHPRLA